MADVARPLVQAPFSFGGTVEATRLSWAYRAGLVVVALAMLVLPLIYLGVIGLAGTGVWWHLTRHTGWLQGGGGAQWRLLAYVAPAVAGTAVTFFMVKPVFARRLRMRDPLALEAADNPQLFAFIEDICRHVRAPIPTRVQVDCQVNASASFARGWQSMVRRDLVLTIGLPLVHALTVRELGGVLAHEFGHFAQGSGLRLTMVVRGINAWFSRVVYERDTWDWRLDTWTKEADFRLALLILPSRAGVWLSRQVLRLLMIGGHVISCFLMRQMEYDADSYEVKVAGSRAFATTMQRLRELHVAMAESATYVQSEFAARRLPADLPLFLVTWQRTRARAADEGTDAQPERQSGLFDTHPANTDRLAAAARAADRGVLVGGDVSAVQLFGDFDGLCRLATRHHYEDRGVLEDVRLVEAVDAVRDSVGREERLRALVAAFDFGICRFRTVRLPTDTSEPPAEKVENWRFPDALERFDDRVRQRAKGFVAQEALRCGYDIDDPSQFGLPEWTPKAAESSQREALERMEALKPVLEPYERSRMHRVGHGLERLSQAGDARYSADDLHVLVQAFNTMASAMDIALELTAISDAHLLLTQTAASSPRPEVTRERLDDLAAQAADSLARIRSTLAGVPYPALLGTSAATLDEACKLTEERIDRFKVLDAVHSLYQILLLEACWLARKGEETGARPAAGI